MVNIANIMLIGSFFYGVVIGWYIYFINRYRTEVSINDLTTLVTAIGGTALIKLFDSADSGLFGAYGIGLAAGFFAYFATLIFMVYKSKNFDIDWFLDGRHIKSTDNEEAPENSSPNRPMAT